MSDDMFPAWAMKAALQDRDKATDALQAAIRERDEARAEVERLRAERDRLNRCLDIHQSMMHPWYGPCDGLGQGGQCAECLRVLGRGPTQLAPVAEGAQPARWLVDPPGGHGRREFASRAEAEAYADTCPPRTRIVEVIVASAEEYEHLIGMLNEPKGPSPALRKVLMTPAPWEGAQPSAGDMERYDPPLDLGIREAVEALVNAGVETFESCEGGVGHAYPVPTVRFHGGRSEGFRAFSAAVQDGLRVAELRRVWPVLDGEPTGPWWEMTFTDRETR